MNRWILFICLLVGFTLIRCERTLENTPPEELLLCDSACMPLRISGQYRSPGLPNENLAGIRVEVGWGCILCPTRFHLLTDAQGRFDIETLVDTTAFDRYRALDVIALVDTSLYLSIPGYGSGYAQFSMFDYQTNPHGLENLQVDLYRKAYLDLELVPTTGDSFRYFSINFSFTPRHSTLVGIFSDPTGIPPSRRTIVPANVPVVLSWKKLYDDDTRKTWTDTLIFTSGEVRPYRITY